MSEGKHFTQQARDVIPMSFYCWATVCDAGPTIKQHRDNVSCFIGHGLTSGLRNDRWRSALVTDAYTEYIHTQVKWITSWWSAMPRGRLAQIHEGTNANFEPCHCTTMPQHYIITYFCGYYLGYLIINYIINYIILLLWKQWPSIDVVRRGSSDWHAKFYERITPLSGKITNTPQVILINKKTLLIIFIFQPLTRFFCSIIYLY